MLSVFVYKRTNGGNDNDKLFAHLKSQLEQIRGVKAGQDGI